MRVQKLKSLYRAFAAVFLVALVSAPAHAAIKVASSDDKMFLNISFLLQSRLELNQNGAPAYRSTEFEAYLRRMRLVFSGQLNDTINFFLETDNPNLGKKGALGPANSFSSTYIQDAFLELNFHPMLQVDMGMLLVPFSHMGLEAAGSLLSTDYHTNPIRYPTGSNNVFRDWGLMVRGMLVGHYIEYRAAILNGVRGDLAKSANAACPVSDGAGGTTTGACSQQVDPRNPYDSPRFAGRVTLNAFDAEGGPTVAGMFYKGILLKETDAGLITPRRVVSLGASIDYQPKLNITYDVPPPGGTRWPSKRDDYLAYDIDAYVDYPVALDGLVGITGQVNYYHYNYGDQSNLRFNPAAGVQYSGWGLSSEAGIRYDKYEIAGSYDMFRADRGTLVAAGSPSKAGDYQAAYVTLVYWMKALQTNFKLEYGATNTGDALGKGDTIHYGWLQGQLFF